MLNKHSEFKKLVIILGGLSGILFSVLLYGTFLVAFFHGGGVIVRVNDFGEALVEFVLLPVFVGMSFFGFYFSMENKMKVKVEEKSG